MSDLYWIVEATATRDGPAYQARAHGRVPGRPGITDTRALGPFRLVRYSEDEARRAAEADGWASGLPCGPDYAPLTARPAPPAPPRMVMTAVPEPVLVPAPTAPTVPTPVPVAKPTPAAMPAPAPSFVAPRPPVSEPDHGAGPAAPRTRRAPARKGR